ncbi:MAG: polysaccharide biosynthesis protein [Actinomyces sp.]|nr:MAG: polysaccharide biosynthesis protein [Actinomyces sp.]
MNTELQTRRRRPSLAVGGRRGVTVAGDVLAWWIALASSIASHGLAVSLAGHVWSATTGAFVVALVVPAVGLAVGLHRGWWPAAGRTEALALGAGCVGVASIVSASLLVAGADSNAVTAVVTAAPLAWTLQLAHRHLPHRERTEPGAPSTGLRRRVVVVGVGDGGRQVIRSIRRDPARRFVPVAALDDDPGKRNLRVDGVRVEGTSDDLAAVAQRFGADLVVVAAPSIDSLRLRRLTEIVDEAGIEIVVVPSVPELLDGRVGIDDARTPSEADLLGRRRIDTDVESIAGYLTDRRVLVTGAGGSIGSEIVRQIQRFHPASVVMVDRDESALHAVQMSVCGRALLDDEQLVVADIRDAARIDEIFARHRPEVVFHTAALKHLPLLELHPGEALKTNVGGTLNVLRAADRCGTERVINISTDKAADATSVLGHTKRVGERLTSWYGRERGRPWVSVRFGNVLGSRGSVLGAFETQIAQGGPVTVTHPKVTRYFMTVDEAVQLVVQAGAVGDSGEVLVLDMGPPVRIDDIARRLASRAPRPVEIVYTGLRPGEKLHEVLWGVGEQEYRRSHPLLSHVLVPPLDPALLDELDVFGCQEATHVLDLLTRSDPCSSTSQATPDLRRVPAG